MLENNPNFRPEELISVIAMASSGILHSERSEG